MGLKILLDTNVASEPLRRVPDRGVLESLERHSGECAVSSVTLHEMWFGAGKLPRSRYRSKIEQYLREFVPGAYAILPYDEAAARWHAGERARLGRAGRTAPIADGQIAAIAAVNDLVLVTADRRGFTGFRGLVVRYWS